MLGSFVTLLFFSLFKSPTFMDHSQFQAAMQAFKDSVRDQINANLQVVEQLPNPYYNTCFVFRYLGYTWYEIPGLNGNETFIMRIAGAYSFLL